MLNNGNSCFSSSEEIEIFLGRILSIDIADMEIDSACERIADDANQDPEFAAKLKAMFDWVKQNDFGDGSLAKIVEKEALVVAKNDEEAKEFLSYLENQIYKDSE